jgi:hypothetical protein
MVEGFAGFESRTPVAATPEQQVRQTVIGHRHRADSRRNEILLTSV